MISAVDTNVLLDVLMADSTHLALSKPLLDKASLQGKLVINETVYTEIATRFNSESDLLSFLQDTGRYPADTRPGFL